VEKQGRVGLVAGHFTSGNSAAGVVTTSPGNGTLLLVSVIPFDPALTRPTTHRCRTTKNVSDKYSGEKLHKDAEKLPFHLQSSLFQFLPPKKNILKISFFTSCKVIVELAVG
jgi:hypothetical protein